MDADQLTTKSRRIWIAELEVGAAHRGTEGSLQDAGRPQQLLENAWTSGGTFRAQLGDGSVVNYSWYRFADQPALLNAGLTKKEREVMQVWVLEIHRLWNKDRNYLPPPAVGELAELDPALIVRPPKGLEAGYVPVATQQVSERH
jgi:hypothetical protein